MSFLGSPITAGPVRPLSSDWHLFISINHTVFCVFLFFIFIISNYSTTLSSGADWWIIDKPPVF